MEAILRLKTYNQEYGLKYDHLEKELAWANAAALKEQPERPTKTPPKRVSSTNTFAVSTASTSKGGGEVSKGGPAKRRKARTQTDDNSAMYEADDDETPKVHIIGKYFVIIAADYPFLEE